MINAGIKALRHRGLEALKSLDSLRPRHLETWKPFIVFFLLFATQVFSDNEIFRVKIWNLSQGTIEVSLDHGKNWEALGKVIFPTIKTNPAGYKAARWAPDGTVAATAVNAIHLKTDTADSSGSGVIFSLLPREFLSPPKKYNSYLSENSSIYTDVAAGEGIFGGGYSPLVGSKILFSRAGGQAQTVPKGYVPALGDKIYILVEAPKEFPKEIVFENFYPGKVIAKYFGGEEKQIGWVIKPVKGIGRFEGTKYASVGRIRANHAGVIDVSTSRQGRVGGFQIVPSKHGSEMRYAVENPQWMFVAPLTSAEGGNEGKSPLFSGFIRPCYGAHDICADDWRARLLERYLVDVKFAGGGGWQPMPIEEFNRFDLRGSLPSWSASSLENVTAIRILFPVED